MAQALHAETLPTERTIVITRILDAPRELVFRAWTDVEHLARWWGPAGFTNPVCEADVREGGAIRITMRAPDGTDYPMTGMFKEIVPVERLVFTTAAIGAGDAGDEILLEGFTTVTFEDQGSKTRLVLNSRAVALSPIAPRMLAGMEQGWSGSLDKLAALLPALAGSDFNQEKTMEFPKPQKEHDWLQQLVGDWTYEADCPGPDGQPTKMTGSVATRSLEGLWIVSEATGKMPNGGPAISIITLGYDPAKGRYVGTFVASMMTYLWIYDGQLAADGKSLPLDAVGPSFTDPTKMENYRDTVTVHSDDHWTLSAGIQQPDGSYNEFMTTHYRRKK
jgi:uncharacterized protein YndB with AHSA1/START domain